MSHHRSQSCLAIAAACLLAAALPGCGSKIKHKVVPVEGRIRFADGTALPAGTILLFNPSEGGSGTAMATTDEDGSFKLTHATGRDGAEVGKYSVLLRAPQGGEAQFYRLVARDYFDGGALAADVEEGMPPLDFQVAAARFRRR